MASATSTLYIKIAGGDPSRVEELVGELRKVAEALSLSFSAVPLPTKKFIVSPRRTPCGDGSDTYEWWELRVHKRLVVVRGDQSKFRQLFRVKVPAGVFVKVETGKKG